MAPQALNAFRMRLLGPHPYLMMVREFHRVIGKET
jgi:tryptophan synthase beta subunit